MFDWFRRKSHQIKGDRIEDSSLKGHIILEDQRNGTNGCDYGTNGGREGKLQLIDILDDLSDGLLAIGTFGLFHHSNAIVEHHFPDLVDDINDVDAVCDTNANFAVTPNVNNITLNANVNIHSLDDGIGATYIMASVKPTIPLQDAFYLSNMNKPTSTGSAEKKSGTRLAFMKKFVEDKSGKGVGSGCNLNKVKKGGLFQRKVHPVDVAASAPESESVDVGKVEEKGKKSKSWRKKCQNTLSCFKGCISPENIDDGHMETELKPPKTNFGRKPYADERWIKTDAEYVVLEF